MIKKLFGVEGAKQASGITVIIDIFRAATVEAFLLEKGVKEIIPVATKEEAFDIKESHPDYVLVGEEQGYRIDGFDFGNSPYEISETYLLKDKTVVHRSSQGTQGIVNATHASEIVFGSFVTTSAIVDYISQKEGEDVSVVAMDGEGSEDDLFADYLIAKLSNKSPKHIEDIIDYLKHHPGGARFLDPNNNDFPEEDFYLCLDLDRFEFFPLLRNSTIIKYSSGSENNNQH